MTTEMQWVIGILITAAGVLATIWAALWAGRRKKAGIVVDLRQSIALPPAAENPRDFYTVAVMNKGEIAVRFPDFCIQLRIKGWKKGFTFIPRTDALETSVNTVHGPFSDSRFPFTLEPGHSFWVLVSREDFDRLMSEKGKVGSVRVVALVTDDIERKFKSKPLKSTITDYRKT